MRKILAIFRNFCYTLSERLVMEKTKYEEREAKLLKHGKRVAYGTLAFCLLAAVLCVICLLLQYDVIFLKGTGRIILLSCIGAVTAVTFGLVFADSLFYRKQYREFIKEFGSSDRKS